MLYLLTQHSLWNRTHHPFLLCTCKRGEGVVDSDHQCKILSHEDQLNFWNRSFRRWNDKIQRSGPENYSIKLDSTQFPFELLNLFNVFFDSLLRRS